MKSLAFVTLGLTFSIWGRVEGKRSRKLEDTCLPDDYHFEFTDCDADGGRWRVPVPNSDACENTILQVPPRRLTECFKSCEAGQFLNLTSLDCEDCKAGSYSLGGGIVFDEWDPLPEGFKIQVEKFRSMFSSIGRQYSGVNCSKWGWRPRRDLIASQGGPCVAILIYTAQLVKPGRLKFTYQYADDSVLFQFQANSDQCESLREAEGSRWPSLTGEGIWRTEEIPLHTGLNIFQWKTMGIDSHRPKPVMIKRIEIEGVGYTSSCKSCPAGYFSNKVASKMCTPCPQNSYSMHQSTKCIPCDTDNFYSELGSDKCLERPPCTEADYYQIHEPCRRNQTKIIYEWVQPKICLESLNGAVRLPPPGEFTKCPPCNSGEEYRDGSCKLCKPTEYSDGITPCTKCPPNTQPSRGHHLTQWYSWPHSGFHITCISPEDSGCSNSPSWELHGNYTQTGKGHEKWVYLVMTLSVAGFRGVGRIVTGELHEVGRVTFTFEMKCAHDCELLFMQGTSTKNATVIQRWLGSHAIEEFSQPIYRNDTYDFSWAFQKLAWDSLSPDDSLGANNPNYQSVDRDEDNWVRIYQIHVKNSIDGGASVCLPCKGSVDHILDASNACVACSPNVASTNDNRPQGPNGNSARNDQASTDCLPCPTGHVRVDPFATDTKSCRPCGPGLITKNGFDCVTDCIVKQGEFTYDLRPLQGFYTVRGSSLFTASGTQYFHVFNISFCMDAYSVCEKNVSLQHGDTNSRVEALVCQSTIFPPALGTTSVDSDSSGFDGYAEMMAKPLSTHASSLGDHLVGISPSPSILGFTIADDIRSQLSHPHQFHFFYSTPERTIACPNGRSTVFTFRCQIPKASWNFMANDNVSTDHGAIKTPDKCPDGTCNGCNFHFIWETPFACHLCAESELTIVKGECKDGFQQVHYLPSQSSQCLPKINSTWPTVQKCQNHLPLFAEIAIQIAVGLAVVLSVVLICFWRRHRKLEYKYMKLIASGGPVRNDFTGQSQNSHPSERNMLPVAESCALDPEDEDEDEIYGRDQPSISNQMKEVSFQSDSTFKHLVSRISILDKLKTFSRKGEAGNSLEIMNLTDKEACS